MLSYTLTLALICLFTVAFVATGLSLLDSWLRGSSAYRVLKRERALLDAGFVPQVHAHELRLRKPARRTLASTNRSGAGANGHRILLPTFETAA